MFSKLGRSISRLSRSRNVLSGGNGGRSLTLTDSSVYQSRYIRQADDKLVVLKRYLSSLAANNQRNGSGLSSKVYISDKNHILPNPGTRRFFTSLQKKNKSSAEEKAACFVIALLLIVLLLSSWFAIQGSFREISRLHILLEKIDKLMKLDEERVREWKVEAEEEKEG